MEKNKKIILSLKTILIIIILIITSLSTLADINIKNNIQEINRTYKFNEPRIELIDINQTIYHRLIMENTSSISKPGEPKLPVYESKILLPQDTKIHEIKIGYTEKINLGNDFNIEPSGQPVPISKLNTSRPPEPNPDIYNSNNIYPSELYEKVGVYSFRGYNILVLNLHPIQYIPSTGELYYYKELVLTIELENNNQSNPLLRNIADDINQLIKKIDNSNDILSYINKPIELIRNNYDLLILTSNELKDNFQPLKDIHDLRGIKTEIKTLKDISILPKLVTTEDIRDFIREEYLKNGIEYVLIGGDVDIIPAKKLWVETFNGGDSTWMTSDLYYSCLDGEYNHDNDNKWGEPTDGDNGEDVDLIADVFVGRACVSNSEEADIFVTKTIRYMETGGYTNGKSLLVGEKLSSKPETYGGDYLDEIVNKSHSNMYITMGIPLDQYIIQEMYDRDTIWTKSDLVDKINKDVRIINHVGHCSLEYMMKIDINSISLFTNEEPFFIYSQGCFAGGFDYDDCIGEYFTIKTSNAAFAAVMNAEEGWAEWGGTNGPSQYYHRQFWDAVYGENITVISKANQDSKEDNINHINSPYMRWCYYELNLLGDPVIKFYDIDNNPPDKPSRPSGLLFGRTDKEYNLTTNSIDIDGDALYYRWDFGDGTFSDWIGPYKSGEEIKTSHTWLKIGRYPVKVKTRDQHMEESEWSYRLNLRIIFKTFNPFFDKIINLLTFL